MVPDALKIFGNHQQVHRPLPLTGVCGHAADQRMLHPVEPVIHNIVLCDDFFRQHCIMFHVGVNTFRHHFYGGGGHIPQQLLPLVDLTADDDLGNVLRLIPDALQIRDHFQGRRDLPQIPCHRLLLQKQLQAQGLDVPLLAVDLRVQRGHLTGQSAVSQRFSRQSDALLAQCAHFNELPLQLGQLFIKPASHYPNLPVM